MTTLTDEQEDRFRKIRGLLTKAESTENENEADAFFAKVEELMIRYRIDEATLWANDPSRREKIDQADFDIKDDMHAVSSRRSLLGAIARLHSCRMYYLPNQNLSKVVGYPKDLLYVDMLYKSVMKQGSFKMAIAQARDGRGMHQKTFRNGYWKGYCERLIERLAEANRVATVNVAYTGSQELVLASRRDEVNKWVDENLNLRTTYSRGFDNRINDKAHGAGRAAANTTDISGGTKIGKAPTRGELT